MKRKVLRKKKSGEILQKIVAAGVLIGLVGWLMVACATEPVPAHSEYINENHIGQVEISKGYWVSREHYEEYEAERKAYMESEAESEEAEREAFIKSLEETTAPAYMHSAISEEDAYMLAKIAMAEAEAEDTIGKALVIRVVLNRVAMDEFPDTVEEVITQNGQFTPMRNGRYKKVEPNADCYEALHMVKNGWDESQGALYFEATAGKSTWHSNNLKELFTHGGHTFYKE